MTDISDLKQQMVRIPADANVENAIKLAETTCTREHLDDNNQPDHHVLAERTAQLADQLTDSKLGKMFDSVIKFARQPYDTEQKQTENNITPLNQKRQDLREKHLEEMEHLIEKHRIEDASLVAELILEHWLPDKDTSPTLSFKEMHQQVDTYLRDNTAFKKMAELTTGFGAFVPEPIQDYLEHSHRLNIGEQILSYKPVTNGCEEAVEHRLTADGNAIGIPLKQEVKSLLLEGIDSENNRVIIATATRGDYEITSNDELENKFDPITQKLQEQGIDVKVTGKLTPKNASKIMIESGSINPISIDTRAKKDDITLIHVIDEQLSHDATIAKHSGGNDKYHHSNAGWPTRSAAFELTNLIEALAEKGHGKVVIADIAEQMDKSQLKESSRTI